VMSPRPGRIIDVIESDLPANRTLDVRETSAFLDIAHRVRVTLATCQEPLTTRTRKQ